MRWGCVRLSHPCVTKFRVGKSTVTDIVLNEGGGSRRKRDGEGEEGGGKRFKKTRRSRRKRDGDGREEGGKRAKRTRRS